MEPEDLTVYAQLDAEVEGEQYKSALSPDGVARMDAWGAYFTSHWRVPVSVRIISNVSRVIALAEEGALSMGDIYRHHDFATLLLLSVGYENLQVLMKEEGGCTPPEAGLIRELLELEVEGPREAVQSKYLTAEQFEQAVHVLGLPVHFLPQIEDFMVNQLRKMLVCDFNSYIEEGRYKEAYLLSASLAVHRLLTGQNISVVPAPEMAHEDLVDEKETGELMHEDDAVAGPESTGAPEDDACKPCQFGPF